VDTAILISVYRMSDLRRRFEAPNDSNRWDSPLFKVNMSTDRTEQQVAIEPSNSLVTSVISETVSLVPTPVTPSVFKSAWKPKKSASLSVSDDTSVTTSSSVIVSKFNQDTNINSDGNKSVFFSGTLARRQEDLLKDFCSPEDVIPRICAYLLEAVAPSPNSSTVAAQHADADLLYELDRTSQRIIQLIAAHQTETVEGTPLKFAEFDRELTLHRHAGLAELQRHRRQFVKINGQHPPGSSKAVGASFIDFLALQL
jgi:tRNA uridine 5-carbamoylmethylation protein Kti12